MTGHVKIITGPHWPTDASIELDGHKVQGIVSLSFNMDTHSLPTVTLTIEPETIEYDGPHNLVELMKAGGIDSVHLADIDR